MKKFLTAVVSLGSILLASPPSSMANDGDKGETIYNMGEIEVTASEVYGEIYTTPEETVIDVEKYEIPGVANNVTDIVKKLPVFDFRGKTDLVPDDDTIFMRGFSSKRFVTSIDGLTVMKTGGRKSTHIVDYALLPTWLFERIEVKPGSHSALYPGKSIGGVLNLVPQTPEKYESLKPDVNVNVSYGSYNTQNENINVRGGAGSFIYDFGFQRYYTDGYLRHTEAEINTFFGRVGYIFPSDGYITLSASYADADRETTVKNPGTHYDTGEPDYDGDFPRVEETTFDGWQDPTWDKEATSWRLNLKQPTDMGIWSVQGYYSEENRDYSYLDWVDRKDPSLGISDASWDTQWQQQGGKIQDEIKLSENHVTTLGVELAQCYDGYGRAARWSSVQEDHKRIENIAGYAQHQWTIIPRLNLTAGLRYEDAKIWVSNFSTDGKTYITGEPDWIEREWHQFIPKSFLTWELDDVARGLRDTSVSLGVSKIWRAPGYHGDYNPQGRPAGAWLDPEHGFNLDLVFTRRLFKDINLKMDYGYYEIKDFIADNSTFAKYTPPKSGAYDFQGLEYSDYRVNLEKVVQHTFEMQIDGHILDDLYFYLGYAYLDFDNRGDEPAGETECDSRAKNRVTAGLKYDVFENTRLMLDYIYQDEQVTEQASEIAPDTWSFTKVPMDAYHVFDLAVRQTLFKRWGHARNGALKLYVNNLFDEGYTNTEGYPATDRTFGAALSFGF